MKKILGSLIMALAIAMVATSAFAGVDGTPLTQSANVTVKSELSIAFANTEDTVLGGGAIPFTDITPNSNVVNCDGHLSTKSDTGVICRYNGTGNWALKMKFSSPNGLNGKMKYYMAKPTYNSVATNGTLGNPTPAPLADWPRLPADASDLTTYTSGTDDKTNVPNGTFVGISYGIDPSGLATGTSYSGQITYTITGGV